MARRKSRPRRAPAPNRDTGTIEIDNPYYTAGAPPSVPRRIVATRSLRDDPLARLHQRRQIGEPEYRAGRAWQALYEAAEVGRIAHLDPGHERVDGDRRIPDFVTDRRIGAIKRLASLSEVLGRDGAALVRAVLGERRFLNQIATEQLPVDGARSAPNRGHLEYLGRRFRECLSTLAEELGYAAHPPYGRSAAIGGGNARRLAAPGESARE